MSIDYSPNIEVDYLLETQAQGNVTNTQQMNVLDTLVQGMIKDLDLSAPPGGESDGDRYFVAGTGSGAWAGHDDEIATKRDGQWQFDETKIGYRFWIEDEAKFKIWNGSVWKEIPTIASGCGTEDQIYYVGKHGFDANGGRAICDAVLTIGQAITLATAASPGAANKFVIVILDAGIYEEDNTLPQYVSLHAPAATVKGKITYGHDSFVNIFYIDSDAGGDYGIVYTGTGDGFLTFDSIVCSNATAGCISQTGAGSLHAKGKRLYPESYGLSVGAGVMNISVEEIEGDAAACAILTTGITATVNFKVNKINCGTGIWTNTATTGIGTGYVNEINATTALNIAANNTLNLSVGSLTGTITRTGTLNMWKVPLWASNDGEILVYDSATDKFVPKRPSHFDSWNFFAPTGRVCVTGPYARAAATNLFTVNASGRIPKDFGTLVKASVRLIVTAGDPTNSINILFHCATSDEPSNTHTYSGNGIYAVSAVGDIAEVDITSVISGLLGADDSFGIRVGANAAATTLDILTFDIEYIPNRDATQ